jgi:tetratricopeptide (TPR) repeat protein
MQTVFHAGQTVAGRYRIVRYLSRGGMGEVYEARDLELDEAVALKTLLPEIAGDESMIARFKQEIALSRKVAHPNVCRVFDLAWHEEENARITMFLTMEFLPGETLSEKVRRDGPMSTEEALPFLVQMASALDAAHTAGVIHRDFKPSNVMLVLKAGDLRAVVTDFGLARRIVSSASSTATMSKAAVGTVDYMAPEVLTGGIATERSDLYALGMTAYKMVTGALPFKADTPLVGAMMRLKGPVPSPRVSVPQLDVKWERAILRALDPKPARRFARAGEFVQALRGEPVSVTMRLPVITRWRIGAAALAAVALAGVVEGWRWWETERDRPPPEAAALYRTGVGDIEAGAYFAATKALVGAVRIAPRFSLAHARLAEAWVGLEMPEKASQEMLLARRQDNSGLPEIDRLEIEAVDLTITREFPAAAAISERMIKLSGAAAGSLYVDLGRALENAGKPDQAIESYRRAAEGPSHDPAAWLRLAALYSQASKVDLSEAAFREADEIYQQTSNLEGTIEVAFQRGRAAYRTGQLEESAAWYRKALDAAHLAGNLQQEIRAKLALSTNAYLRGDADGAGRYAREALDSAQANQMETLAISGIVNMGNVCNQKRDFACAEKNYQDALTLARRNEAPKLAAISLLSLASLHYGRDRYDDAAREAQEALAYYQPNAYAVETSQALTLLGRADRRRGKTAAALDSFQRLLDFAEKRQNRPLTALAHESIGFVYADQQRYPEALEQYQKNLEFSADASHIGYARLQCGDVLWMLGRYDEAETMFGEVEKIASKFPDLALGLTRARVNMELSRNRYARASAQARRALDADTSPSANSELKAALGLALLGSGKEQEGLRMCEDALASAATLGDQAAILSRSLAVLRARLEMRDRVGALALFQKIEPALGGFPESRWRALALMSRLDQQYLGPARQALDNLSANWGKDAFRSYLARPDIGQLSRPLL